MGAMKLPYDAPAIREIGSLEALTQTQKFNKVGNSSDVYSNTTPLIGSLTTPK